MWWKCFGKCRVLLLVLCVSELLVLGLLLFSQGFLLTRQVVSVKSGCEDFDYGKSVAKSERNEAKDSVASGGCWLPQSYSKAVVLLVDALRYDFAEFNHSLGDGEARPYQNKMPVFEKLQRTRPGQCVLARFLADAPTTTLQRLKGLTTGSLPTFIDASHNFASEEISEDNIIDQLVGNGKRVTFLGDDTWNGLYPGRFHRSHFYPSFNVMDLHTVDAGVAQHLLPELQHADWDVLIAHFLGVDHCGHRYGPNHPEMSAKLQQMNDIIQSVADAVDNNTLLVVMGDHGMTPTGDHGGDSFHEVNAAIFVYSAALNVAAPLPRKSVPSVAQVDLVPSLALALGVPIPYSSLGKVMDFVILGKSEKETNKKTVDALSVNVKQVQRYLKTYKSLNNVYPPHMWEKLEKLAEQMETSQNQQSDRNQNKLYKEYLTLAKLMCEEIWAKFDIVDMISGLVFMLVVIVTLLLLTQTSYHNTQVPVVKRIVILTVTINCLFVLLPFVSGAILACGATLLILLWVFTHRQAVTNVSFLMSASDFSSLLIAVLLFFGSFSNSFVIVENYVIAFVLLSSLVFHAVIPIIKRQRGKASSVTLIKIFRSFLELNIMVYVLLLGVVFVCVRVSSWFWKCREEQYWCIPSQVHVPLTGLPQELHNWRYFTSLVALVLLVWLPRRWLLSCGNMNGMRMGVLLVSYVPIVCGVLVASHWALQAVSVVQNSNMRNLTVIPARISYVLVLLYLAVLYYTPLLIYELPSTKTTSVSGSHNPDVLIPQLYNKLKEKYDEKDKKLPDIPVVYGLATCVSAPLVSVVVALLVVVVLVAGDGVTSGVLLLLLTAAASLLLCSLSTWRKAQNIEGLLRPGWASVCTWFFLSLHGFYATGHHPTFPSLHWSAAFVGFEGDWMGSNIIPAALVTINTFSSQILFGVAVPLVAVAPLTVGVMFPKLRGTRFQDEHVGRGEFLFVEEPEKAENSLVFVAVSYIALHAAKTWFSAGAAFILRRHLMVWKIFAPHFIFEAVGLLVTCGSVLCGLVFTLRVLQASMAWSESLYKMR